MKKFILLLLSPCLLWVVSSHAEEEPLTVFIFAGQSNMVGKRSQAADLPKEYQGEQADILMYTGEKWEPYRPGLGQAAGFGPEVSAALDLSQSLGKPIGIIKHSVGGTNLASQWHPDKANNLYAKLAAKAAAAAKVRPITIAGALWMQGGADARSEKMAKAYAANLDALIAAMRRDFGNLGLRFVSGRTTSASAKPHPRYPAAGTVLAAQMQDRENYVSINTSDITKGPDKIHYDTPGVVLLGQRMADAMESLLSAKK